MPLRASLAVTEQGGNHPRAIATRLSPDPRRPDMLRLDGEKTFATMGPVADVFLIAATEGPGDDGRPRIRLVRVGARASGVTVEAREPLPFAPEIPHARVKLEGVSVSSLDVLPGDGYARYLQPFRTHEDVHVLAATLSWLLVLARTQQLAPALADVLVGHLHALASVAAAPEGAAHAHIGLAGVFASVRKTLVQHHQALAEVPEIGERFVRDLPLLDVAEGARTARTAAAWQAVASVSAKGSVAPTPATP
jgi:alkylation response protein AidB-like acyl-CoA dehydrogenase